MTQRPGHKDHRRLCDATPLTDRVGLPVPLPLPLEREADLPELILGGIRADSLSRLRKLSLVRRGRFRGPSGSQSPGTCT